MDTSHMPTASTKLSLPIMIVTILAGIGILWWFLGRNNSETSVVQELNTSLSALSATTSMSVPVTADPLKQATPAVNPIEKTNPFNNTYENPFQ